MPQFNVHLFREMRLYFPGIEAESQAEAARIASETDSCEAEEVEDCDGADLGAMVDVVGDQGFAHSAQIDFEPARMAKVGPELAAALKTVVEMEYDRDEESRNFDEERLQYFSSLIAQAEGKGNRTHEEIRKSHSERLHSYRQSAEFAHYAKAVGLPVPPGDLPTLLGQRWEIDQETYQEFLEVLPPLARHNGSFYLSEFTFDNITTKYTKEGDRYYCEFARYQPQRERPVDTPWGHPDTVREIGPGIIRYDTPSHGGYWLSPERVAEMPPCLRAFKPFAGASWYEEDVDWSVVALAFPQYFPDEAIPAALATLRHSKPELFAELVKDIDLPKGGWQRKLTEANKTSAKRVAGLGA